MYPNLIVTGRVNLTLSKMKSPTHKDEEWLRSAYSRALHGTKPCQECIDWIFAVALQIDPDQGDKPLWSWPLPNF